MPDLKKVGEDMVSRAMKAVDPYNLVLDQVERKGDMLVIQDSDRFDLSQFENIYVIGMGKGTAPMAAAVETLLDKRLTEGAIVVKYGHTNSLKVIRQYEAGHPLPDENTLAHTEPILDITDRATEKDLVIVLITGGGSALLESLAGKIELEDLSETNRQLLASGATIQEINTIRKHISEVKGGRLAARIWPAQTVSLILSDVIGDPLESIASGPTAPDPTTFRDALRFVYKYGLEKSLPTKVLNLLQDGETGTIEDTPDPSSEIFGLVKNYIIGNNRLVLERVHNMALEQGFHSLILTDQVEGEAREIARLIAAMIRTAHGSGFPVHAPGCVIMGGEPTVTLRGKGRGGRNQELTLAVLNALGNLKKSFYFCSVGTDGTDGPTDAAGAWIDQDTMEKVSAKHLDPLDYLNNNDAYHFFKEIDQLIKTGPTRTNVMDLIICLVR